MSSFVPFGLSDDNDDGDEEEDEGDGDGGGDGDAAGLLNSIDVAFYLALLLCPWTPLNRIISHFRFYYCCTVCNGWAWAKKVKTSHFWWVSREENFSIMYLSSCCKVGSCSDSHTVWYVGA